MIEIVKVDHESVKFKYTGKEKSGPVSLTFHDEITGLLIHRETYDFNPGEWVFWVGFAPMLYKNMKNVIMEFSGAIKEKFLLEFPGKERPFTVRGAVTKPHTNGDVAFQTFIEIKVEEIYHNGPVKICPGDIVLDIGANYGFFTIYAAERGAKKVLALEPFQPTFMKMIKNVGDAGFPANQIFGVNAAIADTEGQNFFEVSQYSGSSYLSKNEEINETKKDSAMRTSVKTMTINGLLEAFEISIIDFLKVDCEGGEVDLFSTIKDEHLAKVQKTVIEYHSKYAQDVVLRRLERGGFFIHEVRGTESIGLIYAYKQ
jgi:FkbM family methyltransferase